MKAIAKLCLFGLILTSCAGSLMAQTYADEESEEDRLKRVELSSPELLQSLGINNAPNLRNQQIQGNSVFLRQIGDLNQVSVDTDTEASEITINQEGNRNITSLTYQTKTAVATLNQLGDFNTIIDFASDPQADVSLDLTQEGSFLNFQREGINELTKSLKFRQTEASPTIIIRSFN